MHPRNSGAVIAGVAALHMAGFAVTLWLTMIRQPFWDMLAWLDAYMRFRAQGGLLGYLFAFHNEHRLAWVRLLVMLDAWAFRSGGLPFIVAATAALLAAAALTTWEAARDLRLRKPGAALLWLFPMLFLSTANAIDCSIPINCVYPLTLAFVVAAIVLFDGAAEAGSATPIRRGAALAMAACAGLANAVGLMAWPMLLWSAWRGRAGWRWLGVIALAMLLYGAAYLHGVTPVGRSADPAAASPLAPNHVLKMGGYLLAYLGLPLSRMGGVPLPGRLLGAAMLFLGAAALVRYGLLVREPTRLQRIATGLIVFALDAAVLAAAGRTDLAPSVNVPVRYTVLVTPLHAGLLALLLPWAVGAAHRRQRCGVVSVAGVVLGTVLLAQQVIGGLSAVSVAGRMRATIARYYDGAREPDMANVVYPDLAVADDIVARLRRDGLLGQ